MKPLLALLSGRNNGCWMPECMAALNNLANKARKCIKLGIIDFK